MIKTSRYVTVELADRSVELLSNVLEAARVYLVDNGVKRSGPQSSVGQFQPKEAREMLAFIEELLDEI